MESNRKIRGYIQADVKALLLVGEDKSFAGTAEFLLVNEQTTRRSFKNSFDNDKTGSSTADSRGKLTQ